jgi:outer membrane protein assembly factor BamB
MLSATMIADGIVYVGSLDGKLYALNAATGELEWSYATGGEIVSVPSVTDGTPYTSAPRTATSMP